MIERKKIYGGGFGYFPFLLVGNWINKDSR